MDSSTNTAIPNVNPSSGAFPPLQSSTPPVINAAAAPPPIPGTSCGKSLWLRRVLAVLLSLCLLLFLADGLVSLLDDCLILSLHVHVLGGLRGMTSLFALLSG